MQVIPGVDTYTEYGSARSVIHWSRNWKDRRYWDVTTRIPNICVGQRWSTVGARAVMDDFGTLVLVEPMV